MDTSLLKVFRYQDYNLVTHSTPLTFTGATITMHDGRYQNNDWVGAFNSQFGGGDFCGYFDIDWMTNAQAKEMFNELAGGVYYKLVPTISSTDELVIVLTLQEAFEYLNAITGMLPEWEESVTFIGGTMRVTPSYTGEKSLKTLVNKVLPFAGEYKLSSLNSKQVGTVVKTEYLQTYYSGAFKYGYKRTIYTTSDVDTSFIPEQCGFNFRNVQIVANGFGVSVADTFCEWEVQNYQYDISETSGEIMGQASKNMCSFSAIPNTNYPISFKFTNTSNTRYLYVSVSGAGSSKGITCNATTFTIARLGTYTLTFTPQSTLANNTTITLTFAGA